MKQELYSDAQLLSGLSEGDSQMINMIYSKYHTVFSKWLITNGGNEDDANDIFQESMVVLYQKSKDIDFCLTCSIGTYIFSVGKRLWYKKIQQNAKIPVINNIYDTDEMTNTTSDIENDIQNLIEVEAQYELLKTALAKLKDPCSTLLSLFYIEQKSMLEITQLLNYMNADTTKVQKYKCLTRLRKLFFDL